MIELRKKDWEDARDQTEKLLRQVEISKIVNENLLNIAIENIEKLKMEENEETTEEPATAETPTEEPTTEA